MVVANIVADVVIGLSGQVRPFLKEDGLFLCSGIIDDRAEEVARHLREAGWDILRTRQIEGWFSYLCPVCGVRAKRPHPLCFHKKEPHLWVRLFAAFGGSMYWLWGFALPMRMI